MFLVLPSTKLVFHLKTCIHPSLTTGFGLRLASNKLPASSSSHIVAKPRESSPLQNEAPSSKLLHAALLPPLTGRLPTLLSSKDWRELITDKSKLPQNYLMLSKIRLTSLVVLTSMAGYALAPAAFDPMTLALVSLGTGLVSCAANSVNQFFEVPFDSQMARTQNRVLVRGQLTPLHAVLFAFVCGTAGVATLYVGANGLTAALGALNLTLYTAVYTPMKRLSILNTWLGSFVGAIPPLMGWAAAMGSLGPGAWVMAAALYAWQFPHFNALSWNLRPDYSKAGYRMMAVTDPALCRRVALRYTAALLALSCAAPALDVTGWLFALESIPLNAYFTFLAWQFYQKSDGASSRKLFRFSLIHLPLLMILLLVNKKHWASSAQAEGDQSQAAVKPTGRSSDLSIPLPAETIPSLVDLVRVENATLRPNAGVAVATC